MMPRGRVGLRHIPRQAAAFAFPWWGYGGLMLILVSWILAWNRFSWFTALQAYTFTPLWMGYILVINGLIRRRRGRSLLSARPLRFFLLFPLSAMFWWYFEYLNRFVQNWYYVGIDDFSAVGYVVHATICFSTVLPAVLSTQRLLVELLDVPLLPCPGTGEGAAMPGFGGRITGVLLLLLSGVGLAFIGIWPDYLFALLWISPLLIITGLQLVRGQENLLATLVLRGDWREKLVPPLAAALVCGFFWEMWNWKSLAQWHYSIPHVDRFHLFAMPILGYAGYLPFGLECYVIGTLIYPDLETA